MAPGVPVPGHGASPTAGSRATLTGMASRCYVFVRVAEDATMDREELESTGRIG
jgi:hypothetical protein